MSEAGFKLAIVAVFALSAVISGGYRLRARRHADTIPRDAEQVVLRLLRIALSLPVLLALIAILLRPRWLTPWVDWARLPLPDGVRIGGIFLGLLGAGFTAWTLHHLGTNVSETVLTKPGQSLVASGPYRHIRHPLYTAGLMVLGATGLMAASGFLLSFVILAGLAFAAVIIPREEAELIARFGNRYRDYRRQTGALLPRIRFGD